jgi:hypothetical protein
MEEETSQNPSPEPPSLPSTPTPTPPTYATIVSAYYEIPSKYPKEFYYPNIQRFLQSIRTPMVFFCDASNVPLFLSWRGDLPCVFVSLSQSEFYAYKVYGYDFWAKQCEIDTEKYHTPELSALWFEKKVFVKRAIQLNPYRTDYFFWCDAGCVRSDAWSPLIRTFGQNIASMEPGKLYFQKIHSIDAPPGMTPLYEFPEYGIAGAIYGAHKDMWDWFIEAYCHMVWTYVQNNKCANMDQYIMASLAVLHPDKIVCIDKNTMPWICVCPDIWFFFLWHYSKLYTHHLE